MVLALLDELLTEPVLLNPDEDEVSEDDVEDVEVDVPVPLVVAAATVADWFDAYASARCRPRPPAVSVVGEQDAGGPPACGGQGAVGASAGHVGNPSERTQPDPVSLL